MRTEPAVHRDAAHRLIAALASVAAGDISDQPGRQKPHIAEPAAAEQHLVEGRHSASGGVAAAARQSGSLELRRIVARLRRVSVGAPFLLASWHSYKDFVGETKGCEGLFAKDVAIILAGHRLDYHRLGQMSRARVVLQPCARGPVEREVAHFGAHPRVIDPSGFGDITAREAA